VPPKTDPRDWDRHFRSGAARRGGPLRALANMLLFGVTLTILGGATVFAWNFGRERARENAAANARMVETSNAAVIATRTARALATVAAVPTVAAATPTAAPSEAAIGRGSVVGGGNLRSEPVVAPETVIGQVCAGDQVDFLEERTVADGSVWYRIRLTTAAGACTPQRVTVGSVGWASATLLSQPAP
jgi:hypothetical protein